MPHPCAQSLPPASSVIWRPDFLICAVSGDTPVRDVQLYWRHCGFLASQSSSANPVQAQPISAVPSITSAQAESSTAHALSIGSSTHLGGNSTKHISARTVTIRLEMWRQQASRLATHLPTTDELEDSDAAVMAALAFAVEVLKHPFELLCQLGTADLQVTAPAETVALSRDAQRDSIHAQGADGNRSIMAAQHQNPTGASKLPEALMGTQTGSPDANPKAGHNTSGELVITPFLRRNLHLAWRVHIEESVCLRPLHMVAKA